MLREQQLHSGRVELLQRGSYGKQLDIIASVIREAVVSGSNTGRP